MATVEDDLKKVQGALKEFKKTIRFELRIDRVLSWLENILRHGKR